MFMRKHSIDLELRSTGEQSHRLALLEGGGKSQVPCLRIEANNDSVWLYESEDIISYLRQRYL